jgi:uncharacterized protein YihD (DUF1040 family)
MGKLVRDPKRIKRVLELIERIWLDNPDLRLCQLIENCFSTSGLYHIEDDELRKALQRCYSIKES